jgi:hypothetical protein
MRLFIFILTISACSVPVPRDKEVSRVDMDEATPDMGERTTGDLLSITTDIAAVPDLSQAPDMTCLVDTTSDVNNCGTCGNVCVGDSPACVSGVCKYLHEDKACEAFFNHYPVNWNDEYPAVDGTNSIQARAACYSCQGIASAYGTIDLSCAEGTNNYTMAYTPYSGSMAYLWFMYSDGSMLLSNANGSLTTNEGMW